MPTHSYQNMHHRLQRAGSFPGLVGAGFVGLSALYGVYAVGALIGLQPGTSLSYRLVTVVGMATFPLPLLIAPAVFIASLDDLDLWGERVSGIRERHLTFLGMVALGAGLTAGLGPLALESAAQSAGGFGAARPQEGMVAHANARALVPVAITLFVVVAAITGSVIGRRTRGLSDDRRIVTRWVAGVLLVALFFSTTFVVGELIVMHGALSPLWLAIAPPLVPFLLTCAVAGRDCARIAESLVSRIRDRRPRMDPAALDDLVTAIREADDPEAAAAAVIARGDADREMAVLVGGLSRVGATAASAIDESRVREIVDVLATRPGPDLQVAPLPDDPLPGPGRAQIAAAVVVIWISLTTGLLLLGGADIAAPTLVSASAAGALGAWATIEIACRDKARAFSSAAV